MKCKRIRNWNKTAAATTIRWKNNDRMEIEWHGFINDIYSECTEDHSLLVNYEVSNVRHSSWKTRKKKMVSPKFDAKATMVTASASASATATATATTKSFQINWSETVSIITILASFDIGQRSSVKLPVENSYNINVRY